MNPQRAGGAVAVTAPTSDHYRSGEFHSVSARASGWQTEVSRLHGAFSLTTPSDVYSGRLVWQETSSYRLVRWGGEPERLERDLAQIRRDPRDAFELLAATRGDVVVEQSGRRITMARGDMVLVPLDLPTLCEHAARGGAVSLVVPSDALRRELRADALALERRSGLGRVVFSMLTALSGHRSDLGSLGFDAACDRILELFTLAASSATPGIGEHRAAIAGAIRQHVRARASDPSLTPAVVAASLGWSVRQIQSVLREQGTTPTELIREARLDLARARLTDPHARDRTVTEIALSSGFGSHAVFCRVFRDRYGMSPTEMRASRPGISPAYSPARTNPDS